MSCFYFNFISKELALTNNNDFWFLLWKFVDFVKLSSSSQVRSRLGPGPGQNDIQDDIQDNIQDDTQDDI